ncbi:MAG: hypothetical protein ACYDAJ_10905 [Nitrosotalea sp.]
MVLTPEFRKFVIETIKVSLIVAPDIIQGFKRTQQIWKFQNESDFIYGMLIGQITGDIHRYYKATHNNNQPTRDDGVEISEIIESYAKDFREIIYKK